VAYKITIDTGGTFTDVVVGNADGVLTIGKSPTQERAFLGVRGGLEVAAIQLGLSVEQLLAETSVLIYSTTRSTNAILEGRTARTALLVTEGFPDILVLREGGKLDAFDIGVPYPDPYIPRHLTFEVAERIDSEGGVVRSLDEPRLRETLASLGRQRIEAIAVCLLWSVANGVHERRVGELIAEMLPDVPFTLSHELNPIVREYRRASSTAIDASLKPLMTAQLEEIASDLRGAGFGGELMVATSYGGALHLEDVAARPIDTVRSGPSMAPVAGKVFAEAEGDVRDVIVCDTGGTSFDVSLIRDGAVSYTRETWLGPMFTGHMTGTSSVDIRSIGSGGGSIAWVDPGGLLRVGPQSAGADPGPACYGRGGTLPTVSDAAVVLGFLSPETFLGGRMLLDADAATAAVGALGAALGLSVENAAEAIMTVANEHMVGAIQDITINEGVDPRDSLVVAGGGAAGLGAVAIVKELGCREVLVPRAAGALSATGGQFSDIVAEFTVSRFADSASWDFAAVDDALEELERQASEFGAGLRERGVDEMSTDYFVDARYGYQVYQLEVALPGTRLGDADDLIALSRAFDEVHHRVFAVSEPGARIECLTWKARLRAPVGQAAVEALVPATVDAPRVETSSTRPVYFDREWHDTAIFGGGTLGAGTVVDGPLVVEEATSTLVVPPGSRLAVTSLGNYLVEV
jgi:N-methylhydantoinase A